MWYVIQVKVGTERAMLDKIARIARRDTYKSCVVPAREHRRKRNGEWTTEIETLFPGYLLVETKTPALFRDELNSVLGTTKMLVGKDESGRSLFLPVQAAEIQRITDLTGNEEFLARISTGIIEGESVTIHCGPLKGHEGLIKKVDRHKRVAYVELEMFGRKQTIKLGMEITEKR